MGWLSDARRAVDRASGGILPGGLSPGEVRYRDTLLGKSTGGLTAVLATPAALIGGGFNAAVSGGQVNPLTTWAGAYRLGSAGRAGSVGENSPWKVDPAYVAAGGVGREWAKAPQAVSEGIGKIAGHGADLLGRTAGQVGAGFGKGVFTALGPVGSAVAVGGAVVAGLVLLKTLAST